LTNLNVALFLQRFIALSLLGAILFLFRDLFHMMLFTFLISYFFYSISHWMEEKLPSRMQNFSSIWYACLYWFFWGTIGWLIYRYAPIALKELGDIFSELSNWKVEEYSNVLNPQVVEILKEINIEQYFQKAINQMLSMLTEISTFLLQFLISILLSFFFVLEKDKVITFLRQFQHSKISFLYKTYAYFFKHFLNSFGKMMQLQVIISFINTILSMAGLWILGFSHVLGLGIMIFFLGFIPVAGVIISLIPLSIIAFQMGGWTKVIHVLIMIAAVHALESYVLNPKLISMKTHIPVFFTFVILIVSEHVLGIWGLIIGFPLFLFFLDIISPPNSYSQESKNLVKNNQRLE